MLNKLRDWFFDNALPYITACLAVIAVTLGMAMWWGEAIADTPASYQPRAGSVEYGQHRLAVQLCSLDAQEQTLNEAQANMNAANEAQIMMDSTNSPFEKIMAFMVYIMEQDDAKRKLDAIESRAFDCLTLRALNVIE